MKNILILILFVFSSFTTFSQNKINWRSIEQIDALQKKQPKKLLVYVYTDWCGVCKSLERDLFKNKKFIKKANNDFYAVKFNAEQKKSFIFNNKKYVFIGDDFQGKHEFAYEAMDDTMAFPGMAFYDENYFKINTVLGKQKEKLMVNYLDFISSNSYKSQEWFDYSNQNN